METILDNLGGHNVLSRVLTLREAGRSETGKGTRRCYTAGVEMEEGSRVRGCRHLWKLQKAKRQILSRRNAVLPAP